MHRPACRADSREGTITGRSKLAGELIQLYKTDSVAIHETADPEVIIVEYELHGKVLATERHFTHSYIMVMRITDGLIALSRDYSNPLAVAESLGNAPELLERIRAD
ncbi:nuclear transport factor 2 family protein [Gordoniibacillus kamchatkensis]|uniref:nuclear transport factor 2 family protein n=1 Tax=Gordoniibacillus kamchatkensis TaxID=1590651 RepID=UPI0006982809|nr:PhzA/PhzB family protein [Paenibacillus sp. VKM B-2647]